MSIARVVYTQTVAGNKNFAVPFPYISRDHVSARVNGAGVNFTWNSTNIVTLNEAPPVGAKVELRRSSSINDKLVVFTDGSTITETDLNLLATQTFFLAQEADDLAQESNALARDATATANSAVTTANSAVNTANTASSVASQAASNAASALSTANSAVSTANSASTKANSAVTTAGNAQTASAAAQQASTNAVASANAAVATADSAKAAADTAVAKANTAIATANSASTTAQAASTSASTAVGVAGVAANLAQTASDRATDAEAAAASAAAAAQAAAADAASAVATASGLETTVNQVLEDVQAIAGGDLSDFSKNSLNLSDLTNKATARANLGLGNVDNTSDANKPISNATQTALNAKAPVSHTHDASAIVSGTIADARLPVRLREAAASITDWNNAQANGWYMADNAANAPMPNTWFIGSVENHGAKGWCTQLVHAFSTDSEGDTKTYRRERNDGTWGTWQRCRITEAEQLAVTQAWWNSTNVPIGKVTGLQSALDGKASLTGGGASGTWGINITGESRQVTNPNTSPAVRQIGDIGNAYASWDGMAWPAVQLDAPNSNAAYMIWRATRWGARHVAAMHVYEGNMTVTLSVGALNNYTWDGAGNFTAAGNVTAYSDIRLKTDLTKIAGALGKVCALNGYTYTRKDTGERQTGVVAQEVQKVLPEAVVDNGDRLSVAYGNMVGLLVEAIKELKSEVDQLKGK